MTSAPLGTVRIDSVHVTEEYSSVSLLCDESPELRAWLWSTDRLTKGKAEGARFLLTVDGVKVEGRRVFSRPWCSIFRQRLITITSDPGDTRIAALGRKVCRPVFSAELVRVKGNAKQAKLPTMGETKPKRVTVEGLPATPRESQARLWALHNSAAVPAREAGACVLCAAEDGCRATDAAGVGMPKPNEGPRVPIIMHPDCARKIARAGIGC